MTLETPAMPPSKRSNEWLSTPSKKVCKIQGSEDLLCDSDRSSTTTLETPLAPSPGPDQHTDPPMQMQDGQELMSSQDHALSMLSDDTTRPHRIRHPPKKYLDFD